MLTSAHLAAIATPAQAQAALDRLLDLAASNGIDPGAVQSALAAAILPPAAPATPARSIRHYVALTVPGDESNESATREIIEALIPGADVEFVVTEVVAGSTSEPEALPEPVAPEAEAAPGAFVLSLSEALAALLTPRR